MEWLERVMTMLMKMMVMIIKNEMGRHNEMSGKGWKSREWLDKTDHC